MVGVQRPIADLDVPDEELTRIFWTGRANYSSSTDMLVDALVRYDPGQDLLNTNIRFDLTHHPLSDLFHPLSDPFVVFIEQRFTAGGVTRPGRGFIVELTYVVAF